VSEDALSRRIIQVVEIAAPPGKVWRHLTDGTLLSNWLMPTEDFEARIGHSFTFRTMPVGDVGDWDGVVHCMVRELFAERKLSWVWTSNALGTETVVTITLDDLGGRTRLTLEHSGWDGLTPEKTWLIDEHDRGWAQLLPLRLKAQVEEG
jgi:uncharacterized protein YndB with AHSA1/START domain